MSNPSRILALDATRGAAMLLACLAHFAWWLDPPYTQVSQWLKDIGMIATPTFMLLSGAALGLRMASEPAMRRFRIELVDRGLFLLTVAHIFIAWSEVHRGYDFLPQLVQLNSVDAIGIGCILMAAYGGRMVTNPRVVMRVSIAAMALGWLVAAFWHPHDRLPKVVKELLVGDLGTHPVIFYVCPLVQYLSLYAIGTVLGAKLFDANLRNLIQVWGGRLVRAGATAMVIAAGCHLIAERLSAVLGAESGALLRDTFSKIKLPPAPGYLAFFGGAALVVMGSICAVSGIARLRGVLAWLAVLGRASLFVFILQYFVIWTLPDWLGIYPNAMSPMLFVADVALLWTAARVWSAVRGNQFMMFGLRRVIPT